MSDYKLIIFDWDGTLMDSTGRIVSSMQKSAERCGLPIPIAKDVQNIIGLSLPIAMERLFGTMSRKVEEQMRSAYKDFYIDLDDTPTPLFDQALSVLSTLKQKTTLAVATGKGRQGLERVWQQSQTAAFFSHSRCADEAKSKPHPDMLVQLLAESKLEVSQAVMIGDTSYDMQMAETIGMDRIGVSFGAHDEDTLRAHQPKAIIHQLTEILDLV